MLKRVLIILMTVCILAVTGTSIAASAPTLKLTVAEGLPGDTIDITVSISGNPGIAYFKFKLEYDTLAYTPVSIQSGEAITTGEILSNLQMSGADALEYVTAQWYDAFNMTSDGILFTVSFLVNAESAAPFNLLYNNSDVINQDLEDVRFTVVTENNEAESETPSELDNQPTEPETTPQQDDKIPESPEAPSTDNPYPWNPPTETSSPPVETQPDMTEDTNTIEEEPEQETETYLSFSDINGYEWAAEAINVLATKGIIKGTGEYTFSPANNTRRADYMLLTVRLLDLDVDFTDNFDDVPIDAYYYHEIGVAKAAGLTAGTGDNKFSPESFITRQDMFVIAYRIFRQRGLEDTVDTTVLEQFADKDNISNYAEEALAVLVKNGWVKGNGNRIEPLSFATRAEMAVFIYRIYEFINAA